MRRVGLIVVPDVGALSVFELANAKSGEPHYDFVVMSEHGGAVRNSFGMEISTNPLDSTSLDAILMGSSLEPRSAIAPDRERRRLYRDDRNCERTRARQILDLHPTFRQ